ncbi:MAG TPA: transposase [Chthoniobacterales bacterium]|nr:transposase [Chthoniobacterales bacterium]
MPERLRRLEETFQRYPIYFVTACTHQRREILADPIIHAQLIEFAEHGSDHGAWLGDYVLMPNHLHAFVAADDNRISLSTWMKSLKNALSKTLRNKGISPPHWQKGFFDHVLRSGQSYSAQWEYVRQNPVRAGLVGNPDEWEFMGSIFPLGFRDDRVR